MLARRPPNMRGKSRSHNLVLSFDECEGSIVPPLPADKREGGSRRSRTRLGARRLFFLLKALTPDRCSTGLADPSTHAPEVIIITT